MVLFGALTKLDAPVNAPELIRLLISILYDGCNRCINILVNISIPSYSGTVRRAFDAPVAPKAYTSRFLKKLVHPPCTHQQQAIHIDAPINNSRHSWEAVA